MSSDEKIMEGGGEGTSHDTPQAITITIMAPSALETTTIDSALVTSVEARDATQASDSLLVVPAEGEESISVTHGAKDLLQTVTETHMGSEDVPVISNINSAEDTTEESATTIQFVTKSEEKLEDIECEEGDDILGYHCLICNEELQCEEVSVFKSLTTTSQRKVSVFLGILVGQKLTSRKAHSSIICEKCFSLLNKLDLLEVQIRDTKEEIVNKYQDTVAVYGGRARRKKPAAAKKSEYVFPKIEPEDEDQQALALEMDETFEPHVDDLMEEEHDRREDRDSHDEEWEPEFKRARVKRDASSAEPSGAPKRKRGRPRKDASKPKGTNKGASVDSSGEENLSKYSAKGSNETNERQIVTSDRKGPEMTSDNKRTPMSSQEPQEALPGDGAHATSFETPHTLDTFNIDFKSLHCSCGVQSSSTEKYVEHMLMHRNKIFKCPKCSCAYSSSFYLVRHQHLVHSGNEQSITHTPEREDLSNSDGKSCKYCDESVNEDIFEHLKTHLYGENECPVCTKSFYTSQSMETHIQKRHPQSLQLFKIFELSQKERQVRSKDTTTHHLELCDVCGKAVTSSSRLAQHRYSEHPEHYPWPCGDCHLAFPSLRDRDNHICHKKRIRRRTKQMDCNASNTKNKSKTSPKLPKGQGNENRCTEDSINCPVCSVVLTNRKAFTDHMRSHKRNGFKCDYCGAIVKSMANLRTHLSTIHTHREIHQCKKCPQIFFSSGRLSYHLRRHHTDRDTYRNLCHLCGKSYPYPSELRLHLRSHRNERPFKCDQCLKTFMKKGDLTYHKRSHTGERPHKCPHCDARFPRPNTLMSHIRQQHQEGVRVSTADASTTTSKAMSLTPSATTTPPTCVAATTPATVMVLSPNIKRPRIAARQQRQNVDTIMPVDEGTGTQNERTLIPVVSQGQLVEAVVEGQVTEVQYVQVDGLAAGQTVQAVEAHMMEGMEYDESYHIVHLQMLE